ncbi:MAG: DUF2442 domain-containing protein [Clostridiales Family XIII bacterium]|jgi:hypothetical protein|nr:DUF2442 domain-containing protein [Clostridiales Family XIII bacterium]
MELYPEILQVLPTDDYIIYAYMNDGSVRKYDVRPLIEKGGVFAPLADINVFKATATVMNNTAAWDISGRRDEWDCIDIDPYTIAKAPAVADPLDAAS